MSDIICYKDIEQFYRLKWEGWKFPLVLNFNLSVHVDVYVSFVNRKPGPSSFTYKFLRQSVIHMEDPTPDEKKLSDTLNICFSPRSNFSTILTVKLNSKDYSKIKPRIRQEHAPQEEETGTPNGGTVSRELYGVFICTLSLVLSLCMDRTGIKITHKVDH